MPRYGELEGLDRDVQLRCVEHLLSLRSYLRARIGTARAPPGGAGEIRVPYKVLDRSLLVATWNLREFGRNEKHGPRLDESLRYIAEVIAAFDLVALQEVNEDLTDFRRLMRLLGDDWGFLLTDITLGKRGNWERMALVYDRRKVTFEGFASQLVVPESEKQGGVELHPRRQLARTPMMVGFRSGWFRFTICTVHVYYGGNVANEPTRLAEIELVCRMLAERTASPHAWAPNMLLLGDFNIFAPEDETCRAIANAGFILPEALRDFTSGDTGKHYDQIAILSTRYGVQTREQVAAARGGSLRVFDKVFRDDEEARYTSCFEPEKYKGTAAARTKYYREWRTFQISDHRPLWIELKSDFATEDLGKRLRDLAGERRSRRGRGAAGPGVRPRAPRRSR
jgi:endonuclease/exonuclease/phosphatase family metal-dependent hydrolase